MAALPTSNNPLRVAIVSYFAPPDPAVASHRVLRLSRSLLAAGHEVHWVTLDEAQLLARDRTLQALVPPGVVRHGLRGPTLSSRPVARTWFEKVLRSLLHKLPQWFALPDRHLEWTLHLRRHLPALARAQRFDAVILSCGPHGQLLAIPALRRALPELSILVDYRDLLTGNAWTRTGGDGVNRRLQRREQRLLRDADLLFVNSEDARACFERLFTPSPCPLAVMRNAADHELAHEINARWPAPALGAGTHLGFFGTLFPQRRLLPVLEALAAVPDAALGRITLHVYTDARDSTQLLAEDLARVPAAVRERVKKHDYLPFAEAIAAMRAMSALVLVNGQNDADQIFVPGKLYDYLMAQRPILFVGGRGDAWQIVERTSGAVYCHHHDQRDRLAARIVALAERPPDVAPCADFDRDRTFAPLLAALAGIHRAAAVKSPAGQQVPSAEANDRRSTPTPSSPRDPPRRSSPHY